MAKAMSLADVAGGRENNFNLIRMIAACGVLVSHAFPIALGMAAPQPLEQSTGFTLGWVCVVIFFVISGFLITRSFDRKSHVTDWVSARVTRLFPGLIVVLALTTFFYAPVFTTLSAKEYFASVETYTYLPRNISLVWLQYGLPGVFADHPDPIAINGSLWTLVHEVICYTGVFLIGMVGALASRRRFLLASALYLATYISTSLPTVAEQLPTRLANFRELSLPFFIGTAFYVWRYEIKLSWLLAAFVAGLAIAVRSTAWFEPCFVLAISYITFIFAYRADGGLRHYNRFGDYSYGMYIYAFPVQQAAVALAGPMAPLQNIALAFPVTLLFAIASWHAVEKPALDRRHRFAMWLRGLGRGTQPTALTEQRAISTGRE